MNMKQKENREKEGKDEEKIGARVKNEKMMRVK